MKVYIDIPLCKYKMYCYDLFDTTGQQVPGSTVVSVPGCLYLTGDRGSIPRQGDFFTFCRKIKSIFFFFLFRQISKMSIHKCIRIYYVLMVKIKEPI